MDITYTTETGLVAGCPNVKSLTLKIKGSNDDEYVLKVSENEGSTSIDLAYPDGVDMRLEDILVS